MAKVTAPTNQGETPNGEASTPAVWRYVGPFYSLGMVMGDNVRYAPHTFTDAQREAFLAKFPERANWFSDKPVKA